MREFLSWGRNPVLPHDICIPDGEAHVFDDRLYVYGSFDIKSSEYCSEEYHVASTSDMLTWKVADKSLDGKDIPWPNDKNKKKYYITDMGLRNPTPFYRKMLKDMHVPLGLMPKFLRPKYIDFGKFVPNLNMLFAPDCACKDGRYYLYFCMGDYSEGVAVSDNPNGPFINPVRLPCGGIDPAIFIDDDGAAYYYWGQFRANAVKLNTDMVTFDEDKVIKNVVTEEEHGFHEGSSMRKHNGIYYYVYPCIYRENKPTCLAYATSSSPLGPFTYRGVIIDNAKCDPQSWNIHGSIQEFNGQWYVFYHRCSKNNKSNRRLCVEKIEFNQDGTINEVKMTSQGAGLPFASGKLIEGWRACEVDGGAYVDGTDLIMCNDSSAYFRYVQLNEKSRIEIDAEGKGDILVYADGVPLEESLKGIHEIKLVCRGKLKIKNIAFIGIKE